jgi:Ni/Co efflux regulator RcnB
MLKKLLVALVASAFALGAYAQAPQSGTTKAEPATPAEPKGKTGATTEKAQPATPAKPASKTAQADTKKAKPKVKKATADTRKDEKAK